MQLAGTNQGSIFFADKLKKQRDAGPNKKISYMCGNELENKTNSKKCTPVAQVNRAEPYGSTRVLNSTRIQTIADCLSVELPRDQLGLKDVNDISIFAYTPTFFTFYEP